MYIFSYGKKMFFLIDLSRIPLQCVPTITPERGWGGHFIHLLYFCPPQPRLGAIVCWNAGKIYTEHFHCSCYVTWMPCKTSKGTQMLSRRENASRPSHVLVSALLLIGHFRVLLYLCFKTSLCAKPYVTHWVPLTTLQKLNSS